MADVNRRIRNLSPDKLDALMKRLSKGAEARRPQGIPRCDRDRGSFPQSFSQQRQWFMEQLMPGAVYNVPHALRLEGTLDAAVLEGALNRILERHESLRTVFEVVDGTPSQVVRPYEQWTLPIDDLSGLEPAVREARCAEIARAEARRPFDLTQGPLWSNRLLILGEREHLLLVTMHHIISDGWSAGVAARELAALYEALLEGRESPLPELEIQYVDFAAWQQQHLASEIVEHELDYWRQQLEGAPAMLRLPTDRPRPPAQTYAGDVVELEIGPELLRRVRALADSHGATLFAALMAVFVVLLHRLSDEHDISVGTPVANRRLPELESLIGLFINTLVVRTRLDGDPTFLELLERVRSSALGAFDHQDVPFERLVDELEIARDIAHTPLYQVLMVLTDNPLQKLSMPGLTLSVESVHTGTAQLDLSWYVETVDERAMCRFEYNTDLFDRETVVAIGDLLLRLIDLCTSAPERRLSELLAGLPVFTVRLVVTSTFTSEPVRDALELWLERLGLPTKVVFAPYSQVFQELLRPDSTTRSNREGAGMLLLRLEDWCQGREGETSLDLLEENVAELLRILVATAPQLEAPLVICLCPPSDGFMARPGAAAVQRRMEAWITRRVAAIDGVVLVDHHRLAAVDPVAEVNDPHGDAVGHIPYTQEYFAALGSFLARCLLELAVDETPAVILDADALAGSPGRMLGDLERWLRDEAAAGVRLGWFSREPGGDVAAALSRIVGPGRLLGAETGDPAAAVEQLATAGGIRTSDVVVLSANDETLSRLGRERPEVRLVALPAAQEAAGELVPALRRSWLVTPVLGPA